MAKFWDAVEGKMNLSGQGLTRWPAAEIKQAQPARLRELLLIRNTSVDRELSEWELVEGLRRSPVLLKMLRDLEVLWFMDDLGTPDRRRLSRLLNIPPHHLGALKRLEKLWFGSDLTAGNARDVKRLSNLVKVNEEQLVAWRSAMEKTGPEIVRTLYLGMNPLKAVPGKALARLANLEVLYLNNCGLTEIPASIGDLSALRTLNVMDNSLTALPEEIGHLENLELLDARSNALNDVPSTIGRLQALQMLILRNNRLTRLDALFARGRLASLRGLWLDENQLDSIPTEVGGLDHLTAGTFSVMGNPLKGLPESARASNEAVLAHLRSLPWSAAGAAVRDSHASVASSADFDAKRAPAAESAHVHADVDSPAARARAAALAAAGSKARIVYEEGGEGSA